jgi:3-isopropylmalate/(R)-2-methylmalate dehydratase large subunit
LHTVDRIDEDHYLIHIDRCYLHDLSGPSAMLKMLKAFRRPMSRASDFAIPDHTLSTKPGRTQKDSAISAKLMPLFKAGCTLLGIRMFGLKDKRQGIVHVVGPESGLSLPGMTIVCGDSHTCTHGALGALAWGVGTTELYHVLATQCIVLKKPKTLKIGLVGKLDEHIGPMDVILNVISAMGVDFGIGYAVEYTGEAILNMDMEQRMTLCNLTVELGSEYALISPDEKTIEYIKGREFAPKGEKKDALIAHCREIASAADSRFDKSVSLDVSGIGRQISWGITPAHTISVDGVIPKADGAINEKTRRSFEKAYEYMDVKAGQPIMGTKIEQVFIGSCSNGRLSNIQQVAELVSGKHVAEGVTAWVVPGSQKVKGEAERLGLDVIIKNAGFLWGEPCCSLCGGCNGEHVPSGQRCVSTTNRNFIGRQGPGARTHLASPYTAVMAALSGTIE